MLKYKVVEKGTEVRVAYYCEGSNEETGRLSYDVQSNDIVAVDAAPCDSSGFYWMHLASELRRTHGNMKEEGVLAWY